MKMTWTTPDTVQITMTNADLAIIETALFGLRYSLSDHLGPNSLELTEQSRVTLDAIREAKNNAPRN